MDRRKIDQNIHDHCLDACVALFMEYYCVALSENIRKELDVIQIEASDFPNELDTRCRTTIKKEYALRKRKKCIQSFAKGLRYVAGVCVVLLALGSVLFMSVEAIRVPIINYYISLNDEYLEIGASSSADLNHMEGVNWNDPLGDLVPDGYTLMLRDEDQLGSEVIIYSNPTGDNILFTSDPIDGVKRIDIETAQSIEKKQILGYETMIINKDHVITVVWGDEEHGRTLSITASALEESEVIAIVNKLMSLIV